jgi:hypothetical protein
VGEDRIGRSAVGLLEIAVPIGPLDRTPYRPLLHLYTVLEPHRCVVLGCTIKPSSLLPPIIIGYQRCRFPLYDLQPQSCAMVLSVMNAALMPLISLDLPQPYGRFPMREVVWLDVYKIARQRDGGQPMPRHEPEELPQLRQRSSWGSLSRQAIPNSRICVAPKGRLQHGLASPRPPSCAFCTSYWPRSLLQLLAFSYAFPMPFWLRRPNSMGKRSAYMTILTGSLFVNPLISERTYHQYPYLLTQDSGRCST